MVIKKLNLFCFIFVVNIILNCVGIKSNPQFNEGFEREQAESHTLKQSEYNVSYNANAAQDRLRVQIEAYMGVPYRWGGTTQRGMDCSGFVSTVYKNAVNLKLPRSSRKMYSVGTRISLKQLQFGDLVFFENVGATGISHVGIYVGDSQFAHASTNRGVIISNLEEKYYKQRFIGARRVYFE